MHCSVFIVRVVVFLVYLVKSNFFFIASLGMRWQWDWEKPSAAPWSCTDTTSTCSNTLISAWPADEFQRETWNIPLVNSSFCRCHVIHLHCSYQSFLEDFMLCTCVSCLAVDGFNYAIVVRVDVVCMIWHFNTFSAVFPFSNVISCWWRPEISSKYPW